ncbi:MAG: DUF3084 domain-containing protein [Candidatus Eremiobacteraeota bacterium]|nr:DUF3084 domain-containing protein [Candidatus Eremiobacteraeota bacterium]
MGTVGGIAIVIAITLIAGLIAYIGDRVGHQVGRKRLTLFGLRPKYTSTIVAVGTGMTIALIAEIVTLSTSPYARAAFFHLSDINNRVNDLQNQADALEKQTKEQNIVANRGQLMYDQFLIITPAQSTAVRTKLLDAFFDSIVESVNRRFVPQGLAPFKGKSSDPDIAQKIDAVLSDTRVQGFLLTGPVLLVAIADRNLFPNDPIHFTFAPYADQVIFHNKQPIASVEVDGGTSISPNVAYGQLASAISEEAIGAGMPAYFANAIPSLSAAEIQATEREIKTGRGRFYIVAHAAVDVYPHTGGIPLTFALSRTPK